MIKNTTAKNVKANDVVTIAGRLTGDFAYSHELGEKRFYEANIKCDRLSGAEDIIPVFVSEDVICTEENYAGKLLCIKGQLRSRNQVVEDKRKLELFVSANSIKVIDTIEPGINNNHVYLNGYICKKPIYRKTPLGREITDLFFAVNRPNGKSDYIPCVCWGKNAVLTGDFEVGDECVVEGRFQSREYEKKNDDGTTQIKVAYEVSIHNIKNLSKAVAEPA